MTIGAWLGAGVVSKELILQFLFSFCEIFLSVLVTSLSSQGEEDKELGG